MKNQAGFTLPELLVAIVGLGAIGLGFFLLYCAIHFIAKFW